MADYYYYYFSLSLFSLCVLAYVRACVRVRVRVCAPHRKQASSLALIPSAKTDAALEGPGGRAARGAAPGVGEGGGGEAQEAGAVGELERQDSLLQAGSFATGSDGSWWFQACLRCCQIPNIRCGRSSVQGGGSKGACGQRGCS